MECRYLPDRDRRPLARSRLINDDPDEFATGDCGPYDECCDHALPPEHSDVPTAPTALRVSIIQSPVLNTFYHEHPVQLTLDTGATSNMVRASAAKLYGLPVTPASQMARQADGVTPMDVVGEVHCTLTRGQQAFKLDALVVRQLDVDFLAGNPFLARNDIGIRPARRQIVIGGSDVIHYGTASKHTTQPAVRRTQSFLLRNPQRTVILPGEYVQLDTPCDSDPDTLWALEPRLDCPSNTPLKAEGAWPPPQQVLSVDHAVRIINTTDSPILLRTGEQLETVSSYTVSSFIASEKLEDLRNAIIMLCSQLRSLRDGGVIVRVDPAPGFSALAKDRVLLSYGITLEVGRPKNPNKNPVAERAIEELGLEILNLSPEGGPVSQTTLSLATANMNSRIRRDGLSALELWTQRDQLTGAQLPIVDRQIILSQNFSRQQNHMPSAKSKAHGFTKASIPTVLVGDLVFIKGDKDKLKARDKYLVIGIDKDLFCQLRKFTSSQFRSKVYTIPMCDCYPVTPTVLAQTPQGPIRGQTESTASDSDDDPVPVVPSLRPPTVLASPPVDTYTVPVHHSVSPAHSQLPAQEHPPIPEVIMPSRSPPQAPLDPSFTDDAQPTPAAVIPTRKSDRS
ncbi:unnamed protein product [Porites lobata]|uniref:Integrase catalytic domain-containing protein n=1 Tax=Porites lobata TaxID=104759 RepID=A0ABN8N5E1_9CNID|nr:unnamed protein product [Porites lobata]